MGAKIIILNSAHRVEDHFEQILEMVSIGSGAQHPVEELRLRAEVAAEVGEQPAVPGGRQ